MWADFQIIPFARFHCSCSWDLEFWCQYICRSSMCIWNCLKNGNCGSLRKFWSVIFSTHSFITRFLLGPFQYLFWRFCRPLQNWDDLVITGEQCSLVCCISCYGNLNDCPELFLFCETECQPSLTPFVWHSSLKTLEPMTTKLCRDGPHTKSLVTASLIVTRLSITKPSTHDFMIW